MTTDLLKRLILAGTPAELVAEVAQALTHAVAASTAIDRRRERDAARQQDRRDRLKAEAASRDVTGHNVTSRDDADNSVTSRDAAPSPDKAPQTPKINPTPHGGEAGARETAHEGPIPGWILPDLLTAQLLAYLASLTARGDAARNALWNGTPPPPGVTDECWNGFLAHRRAMPKAGKFTPYAYKLLCNRLAELAEDGHPPGALLDEAIARNWITVFPPKDARNDNAPRHQQRRAAAGPYRDPLLNIDARNGGKV